MMLKLAKYEWKATYKTFFLLFLGVLLLSTMPALSMLISSEAIQTFAFVCASISFFPLVIVYLVLAIQRYYKSMYGDEGYLLLTLPVKSGEIILSKLLVFTFWGIMTAIVGGVIFTLFMISSMTLDGGVSFFEYLGMFLHGLEESFKMVGAENLVWMAIVMVLSGMGVLSKIYLSITLGNLPMFSKWNEGLAVIFFFLLNFLEGKITELIFQPMQYLEAPFKNTSFAVWSYPLVQACFIAIFLAATIFLVHKKMQIK